MKSKHSHLSNYRSSFSWKQSVKCGSIQRMVSLKFVFKAKKIPWNFTEHVRPNESLLFLELTGCLYINDYFLSVISGNFKEKSSVFLLLLFSFFIFSSSKSFFFVLLCLRHNLKWLFTICFLIYLYFILIPQNTLVKRLWIWRWRSQWDCSEPKETFIFLGLPFSWPWSSGDWWL